MGNITQTDFGFTGQRNISSLGLYDYHARMYDPLIGRFIQPDSLIPGLASPQSWNRFAYVLNNPLINTDPTGLTPCVGNNYDDGPSCLKNPNSQLSIEVKNTKYRKNCSSGKDEACPGGTKGMLAFLAGGVVTAGLADYAFLGGAFADMIGWSVGPGAATACAINSECENGIQQTGTNTVYRVVENGRTIYYGITQNFNQRAAYWSNTKGWRIQPIDESLYENLSRYDARAVEQVLIEHTGLPNLANQINSIAATNPIYQAAVQRANEILNKIGFFGQ